MNKWFGMAAALMLVTVGAHVFAGGNEIQLPILASGLSSYLKVMSSVIWHMATVTMVINLVVLIAATITNGKCKSALLLIVVQSLAFVGVFLYFGISALGNVTEMPQWIAFGLLAVLTAVGLRSARS